ncbi:hypothetical protein H5410_034405, partial [Solanum commersonii]
MSLIPRIFGDRRSSSMFDPFRELGFPGNNSGETTSTFANTRIDWKETPEAHVFKADLPGLKKEEVKVEIEEDRVLQISGERNVEKEDKNDKWHRVERSSGKFMRRFRLPENAKMDQVKASMENGVLTVTVPKEEMKKPDDERDLNAPIQDDSEGPTPTVEIAIDENYQFQQFLARNKKIKDKEAHFEIRNALIEHLWEHRSDLERETSAFANTRIDWKETPEAHVFKADLPGLKKEEVKVEVEEDRVLQISGERNVEKEDKNDKWHRVERSSGKFMRRFRLPENAKMDQVKASMENGVLTVTVPKQEVKKPEVKSIDIS